MVKKIEKKVDKKELDEALDNLSEEEIKALASEVESEEETVSESEVEGTGGVPEGASKTNAMSIAMKAIAGMNPEQLQIFLASLAQVGHEADVIPSGAADTNQASIAAKGSPTSVELQPMAEALKEDLAVVFGDNKDLSEEFKNKMSVLFEAAVSARVALKEAELATKFESKINEEIESLTEGLIEKIDSYVSYVAEEWKKENEVAIRESLNHEIVKEFMEGLRDLFEQHYITVPEEKQDIADALAAKVEKLENDLNEEIKKNIEKDKALKESRREVVFRDFTSGMTLSQVEKFKQLSESLVYDGNDEEFKKNLNIIKESHFGPNAKKSTSTNIVTEEISYTPEQLNEEEKQVQVLDPTMKHYVSALTRTLKH